MNDETTRASKGAFSNSASQGFCRRNFLRSTLLAAGGVACLGAWPTAGRAAIVKETRDPYRGLKMGITTYTLRKFPLDQAIEMILKAGVKYVSLKDSHLAMKSTAEQRHEVHDKLRKAGLTLTGGGVIAIKNAEKDVQAVFQYAKDAGMRTIVCSPEPEALDLVEKAVRDFDLRVAIHNHGPGDKHFPSPFDVWKMVKERDKRMGLCIDVGHTVRIKVDPVEAITQCKDRLYDFHMKDVTAATPQGSPTELGKGVIDIPAVLKALLAIKYDGNVALEYEANPDNPMPGVLESYAFVRGVLAAS
jgi:inosose dehydratase